MPKSKPDQVRPWRETVVASNGHVVVTLNEYNVTRFRELYGGRSLAEDESLLRYRVRYGRVKLATNTFYFQEGHAELYQPAPYGRFRVDGQGEGLPGCMMNSSKSWAC